MSYPARGLDHRGHFNLDSIPKLLNIPGDIISNPSAEVGSQVNVELELMTVKFALGRYVRN